MGQRGDRDLNFLRRKAEAGGLADQSAQSQFSPLKALLKDEQTLLSSEIHPLPVLLREFLRLEIVRKRPKCFICWKLTAAQPQRRIPVAQRVGHVLQEPH